MHKVKYLTALLTLALLPSAWAAKYTIGETPYDTLYAAFNAAADGDTIVMTADETLSSTSPYYATCSGKKLKLDLNGHKFSFDGNLPKDKALITVSAGELDISNGEIYSKTTSRILSPSISITGGSLKLTGVTLTGYYGVKATGASTITFDGGAYTGTVNVVNGTSTTTVNVSDGTFACSGTGSTCSLFTGVGALNLAGGWFSGTMGSTITAATDGYFTVNPDTADERFIDNIDPATNKTYPYTVAKAAVDPAFRVIHADGTTNEIETLTILNANIADGDTIKLLKDISESDDLEITSAAKVTLDLAGHTFTASDSVLSLGNAEAELTVKDTIGGGQLASGSLNAVVIVVGGTFNLESGIVTNTADHTGIWANGSDALAGTVNVKGGNVYGKVAINQAYQGTQVNVSGGTITGTTAVEIKSGDSFTMSGGTLNCARGIDFLNGYTTPTATLTGGTINATESCIYAQYATQEVTINGASLNVPDGTAVIIGSAEPSITIYNAWVNGKTICDQETTVLKKFLCGGYYTVKPKTTQVATGYSAISNVDPDYPDYKYQVIASNKSVTVDTVPVPYTWLDSITTNFPAAKGNLKTVAETKVGKNKSLSVAECYALGIEPNDEAEFSLAITMNGTDPVVTTIPASARENVAEIVRYGKTMLSDSETWTKIESDEDVPKYHFFWAEVEIK